MKPLQSAAFAHTHLLPHYVLSHYLPLTPTDTLDSVSLSLPLVYLQLLLIFLSLTHVSSSSSVQLTLQHVPQSAALPHLTPLLLVQGDIKIQSERPNTAAR